jgi:hypothetical protein
VPDLKLYGPPVDSAEPNAPKTGIAVWMFPEWFVGQYEIESPGRVRSRPLIHRETLVANKFLGPDRKKHPSSRFVSFKHVSTVTSATSTGMALFTSREADRLYYRFDKYTGRTYRWRVPNTHGLPRSWPTAGLWREICFSFAEIYGQTSRGKTLLSMRSCWP